jgi:hypothetical protein
MQKHNHGGTRHLAHDTYDFQHYNIILLGFRLLVMLTKRNSLYIYYKVLVYIISHFFENL